MNHILSPGSTGADLQAVVNIADSGDIIIISGDMPFTGTVTIPEEKEITIQSDSGNNWIMSNPGANIRHFSVRGSLILQNVKIDGGNIGGGAAIINGSLTMNDGAVIQNCRSGSSGGGINVSRGFLIINEGAVVQNCYSASQGGGAYVYPNGTIIINNGIIRENTATAAGGGIMFQESTLVMTGGEFLGNKAGASGGAIQMLGSNTLTISGGIISGNTSGNQGGGIGIPSGTDVNISDVIISGNTAAYNGGGAYIQGEAIMSNVTVSENRANRYGGGLYIFGGGKLEMTGESYIVKNNAPNGGGIYTVASYNNLTTGSKILFRCNWASTAYLPPANAGTLYPNIQFADTSITDHPLNNFDINYDLGESIDVYFNVTYDANGGTGGYKGSDIIPGETDTVLSPDETGISRSGYTFTGWNTEPNGSGTSCFSGSEIIIGCDVALFAQWVAEPALIAVTYSANGGTGNHIDNPMQYDDYIVLSANQAGISRSGFTFISWNTRSDGSGESFAPGDSIAIFEDVSLYAQWMQNPSPTPNKLCRKPVTKCRTSVEGQKIWIDNDNADDTRPAFVEIILLRDGEEYKRINVDSTGDGYFGFCCLPKGKNSGHKYNYQIDEVVPGGYMKTVEGYNIINTLNP